MINKRFIHFDQLYPFHLKTSFRMLKHNFFFYKNGYLNNKNKIGLKVEK